MTALNVRTPASVNSVASALVCRAWCASRASLISSSSSSTGSFSIPSPSPTILQRRSLVHGSLASASMALLLMGASPCRATDFADDELAEWYRYEGKGFALSVPPDFEDIREPEEFVGGPLYGNKAKPQTFAARFASSDRSEVLSVVIRQSSQLKLTFLAVKDVTDLGSLREASNIFVPVGAKLYAARAIKTSEEDMDRTYYYYEFATGDNYIALEAGASSGQVYVLGVTAPKRKWKDDSRKLRLAASSFSLL
eukprot:c17966_g1_i1 orf=302-1060(-)